MAITPSIVTLEHKLLTSIPSSGSVSFIEPQPSSFEVNRILIVENKPNWAAISRNAGGNSASIEKIIPAADNLNGGIQSVNVSLKLRITEIDDGASGTITYDHNLGSFILRIAVEETQMLTLTPESAVFEYQFGGSQPEQQLINVLSESDWTVTKTKNWVNLPTAAGTNNGIFYIEVVPSGLAAGTHTDVITVVDDLSTKTVAVSLIISEADTDTTFLYVSPVSIDFNYTIGGYSPIKIIEYNASSNWTVSASDAWINLSSSGGVSGVGIVEVSLQNTSVLLEGIYTAEITFQLGGLIKKVYVTLNVFDFVMDLLDPATLYFTKDNNLIELSSLQTETHLSLSLATNYEGNYFVTAKKLPFFNGSAYRRIGDFPHSIIGDRPMLSNVYAVNLICPYDPLELNMTLTEEDLFSDIVYQVVPVNGVRFLKGEKPSTNWLTDMPLTRYMTKKGILTFSILSEGAPGDSISINGAVNQSFSFSNPYKPLYTAIVPIEQLGDLNVGDSFEINVLENRLNVHIIPEGPDHCLVFWENDNGVWDVIEFTGEIIKTHKSKSSSFEFVKDHNTTESKIIDTVTTEVYKINTGWIYHTADVLGLSKLLQASNVYIQFNGEIVKVNPKTRTLEVSKTDKTKIAFDLIFENVFK